MLAYPLARVALFVVAGTSLGICAGEAARLMISAGAFPWGFLPGFLAGGLLSIWQMRLLVMLSTAFLGALAFVWGATSALASLGMPGLAELFVRHHIYRTIVVGLIFLIGLLLQRKLAAWSDREKAGA